MPKIKICGLSRECDIEYVNEAMPDYIGFVFAKSKRQVSVTQAAHLKSKLSSDIQAVGVYVNAPMEEIITAAESQVIDIVQLHGDESEEYLSALRRKLPNTEIIKAFRIESKEDLNHAFLSGADYILLDNGAGGTGQAFDWDIVKRSEAVRQEEIDKSNVENEMVQKDIIKNDIAQDDIGQKDIMKNDITKDNMEQRGETKKFFLAGGIHIDNIESALSYFAPYAIDVSSGVETDGVKDREKIMEIVRRIRDV